VVLKRFDAVVFIPEAIGLGRSSILAQTAISFGLCGHPTPLLVILL
jgi:hypothetical protein